MLMEFPVNASSQGLNPVAVKILNSRQQYRSCHVHTPDDRQPLAAIEVGGQYYSFFRAESSEDRAVEVAIKLQYRGDVTVITRIPKGFSIWVLEPEAQPLHPLRSPKNPLDKEDLPHPTQILVSRSQYQLCHICVPDMEQRLAAIFYYGKYYSLFKTVDDVQQALRLQEKLDQRGDAVMITKTAKGFGLWILEPDAYQP